MTKQITPELLREIGEAMYGPRWKKDLAGDLNVNERTIRRWATGAWPVPEELVTEIRRLVDAQASAVAGVRKKLRTS